MKQYIHQHLAQLTYMALACWFLISMGSVHAHLCFDGQEPPVTFASDVMTGMQFHHDDDTEHKDVDISLIKLVIVKLFKIDLPIVLAVFALLLLSSSPQRHVSNREFSSPLRRFYQLRPPLRAPPLFSA